MRKSLLLAVAIVLFSCNENVRYTQQSPEIDAYKKAVAAYERQDWTTLATCYADTAKIMNNATRKDGRTVAQSMIVNKQDGELFTKWNYVAKESEYEMVLTDKGETWVNFWGLWHGTLKANGKLYEIHVSTTARFIDGKIVSEYGYWDNSKLLMDMQTTKAETSTANTSKTE